LVHIDSVEVKSYKLVELLSGVRRFLTLLGADCGTRNSIFDIGSTVT
jgi:hypothetical protein